MTKFIERWLPIPGYWGYEVSNAGGVRSVDRLVTSVSRGTQRSRMFPGRRLVPIKMSDGHVYVNLAAIGKKSRPTLIHRLVLLAFVGPCPDRMECLHINSVPDDNRLENLKWGSRSENMVMYWDWSGKRADKAAQRVRIANYKA